MLVKGDAIKLETRQAREGNPREPEASPKKRVTGESETNPGGASSSAADTSKRGESEHASNVECSTLLTGCIAAVNEFLCDMPPVDGSHERTDKYPKDALKAGRELELIKNMLNFDAFELMEELPAGKHACTTWFGSDEWRGDRVRSRLCVRQFRTEQLWDDLFAGTPETRSSSNISWPRLRGAKTSESLSLTSVLPSLHARTDEGIYVRVPSGHQEYSNCDKIVKAACFSNKNDINPCIYYRFSDNLDLEQHGDDFLVCGSSSALKCLADEFKKHFMVKKAEIVSLRPEHQKETHFLKRRICVDDSRWHFEMDQRCVKKPAGYIWNEPTQIDGHSRIEGRGKTSHKRQVGPQAERHNAQASTPLCFSFVPCCSTTSCCTCERKIEFGVVNCSFERPF